ncbi:hypothetical protein LINPERHAP1_LOCUS17469 [Linum perenne]
MGTGVELEGSCAHPALSLAHDSRQVAANLERKRRHLTTDSSCTRCGHPEESVIHSIRDCPIAAKVWDELGFPTRDPMRSSSNLVQWCRVLLYHVDSLKLSIICWYMWKSRNEWTFHQVSQTPDSMAAKINSWTQAVKTAFNSFPRLDS